MSGDGVEGFAICDSGGCWNMYPLREALDGEDECPPCRGEDREASWVEEDEVTDYYAEVYSKHDATASTGVDR